MLPSRADVQSIFRAPHSIGMSVSTQDFQRRGLRRKRLIATALLGAMAALFISTALAPQPGFWILLVRATSEAALVGGLADWFAVTALFRQPLGLPVPYTAILPRNKDRIGEGLATFIERNFLSPDILRAKLRSIDPARLVADWLSMPANADAVTRRLVRMLPHLINAIDDRDFRVFIGEALGRHLADIELAPLLGRAIAVLTANGFHETLLDRLLDFCREFLEEREEQLYMAAEAQRRRWWIPKAINRQIARAIIGGVKELLSSPSNCERRPSIARASKRRVCSKTRKSRRGWALFGVISSGCCCGFCLPPIPHGSRARNRDPFARPPSECQSRNAKAGQSHDGSNGIGNRALACRTGTIPYRDCTAVGYQQLHQPNRTRCR